MGSKGRKDLKPNELINLKKVEIGHSRCGAAEVNPTRNHEVAGSIPGLAQWLRIWHCRELWCRSQMRLGSGIAVAVA